MSDANLLKKALMDKNSGEKQVLSCTLYSEMHKQKHPAKQMAGCL